MSLSQTVIHAPPSTSAHGTGGGGPQELHPQPGEETISDDEARSRREQLNRRPSYRMILKDLEYPGAPPLKKEPDDGAHQHAQSSTGAGGSIRSVDGGLAVVSSTAPGACGGGGLVPPNNPHSSVQTSGLNLHLPNGGAGGVPMNALHPLTLQTAIGQPPTAMTLGAAAMAAYSPASLAATGSGRLLGGFGGHSLVDLPQHSTSGLLGLSGDVLGLKPMTDVITSGGSFGNPGMLSGGVGHGGSDYNSSPSPIHAAGGGSSGSGSSGGGGGMRGGMGGGGSGMGGDNDNTTRKRQVRLMKNREAAKECRRKKKEYVKCLENRVSVLENQNKALIEELKTLKALYEERRRGT